MKLYTVIFTLFFVSILTQAQDKNKSETTKIDDDQTYVVLSTKRIQTMEKELDEVAGKGFQVLYSAPTSQYDMAILLKRVTEHIQVPYSYKVLATSRNKTMEKELNEIAKQGYRLLPRTIIVKTGLLTTEIVMLMERAPNSNKAYEYRLVADAKETKLHKKIDEIVAQGFSPVTMVTLGGTVIVMEKETETK